MVIFLCIIRLDMARFIFVQSVVDCIENLLPQSYQIFVGHTVGGHGLMNDRMNQAWTSVVTCLTHIREEFMVIYEGNR